MPGFPTSASNPIPAGNIVPYLGNVALNDRVNTFFDYDDSVSIGPAFVQAEQMAYRTGKPAVLKVDYTPLAFAVYVVWVDGNGLQLNDFRYQIQTAAPNPASPCVYLNGNGKKYPLLGGGLHRHAAERTMADRG